MKRTCVRVEASDTCVCAVLHVCICACCIKDNYYVYIPLSVSCVTRLLGVYGTLCDYIVSHIMVRFNCGRVTFPHLLSTAITVLVFPFLKIYRAVN